MKVLLVLLLLVNGLLAVVVLQEDFMPPAGSASAPVRLPAPGVDRLRLVSEDELLRRIQWAERAGRQPALGQTSCYRIVAEADSAAWARFQQRLSIAGGRVVDSRPQALEQVLGHWVYLPPQNSAQQAARAVARLQAAGVSDFYQVRSGEQEHAVSLGLYANPDNARRRLEDLRQRGFDAQSLVRSEQRPGFAHDIELPAGSRLPDVESMEYQARDC